MQALVDKEQAIEDIAAHFFVTPAVVRQRLKLASVSPTLLDIYGEDRMSLELLMAFTVADDEERQLQVWEMIADAHDPSPSWVRSEEHTSELQSLMRISYAVFCLNKK